MVGFVDAVKMFYGRYADFRGRSIRSEFWWVQLFNVIVSMVLMVPIFGSLMKYATAEAAGEVVNPADIFSIGWIPLILFGLINLIPSIALNIRRFHDRNQTGWLYLLYIAISWIPLVGLIAMIAFIVNFCMAGTNGPNKYGNDPLGPTTDVFN